MNLNLHPVFSSFPLAFLTLTIIIEILNIKYRRSDFAHTTTLLCWATAISTLIVFLLGYPAGSSASISFKVSEDSIAYHHIWGRSILFSLVPLLIFLHTKNENKVCLVCYYIFLLITLGLIIYTGYLGANLIFLEGAGVSIVNS
jgi:uncharacterized membrane protein